MPKLIYADRTLSLEGSEAVLGRHRECTLQVDDDKASRRHVRLFVSEGAWWVEDLESANGTSLNGNPLSARHKLAHQDTIGIGKSRIQFHDESLAPAPVVLERRSAAAQGVAGNPEVLLGRTLGGYELLAVLGKSRLGATYRARQISLAREVAVKIFTPELAGRGEFAERLLEAVRQAAAVKHQYLVRLHECGRDEELGGLWYSMELVDGDRLTDLLERDGALAPAVAGLVIERTALGLQALHAAGLVHRDVQPRNVMLSDSGQVKLGEPGLAEALALGRGTVGDPAFCAPEGPVDARSDLYSLGCLFFTLLTGRPPFAGATPEALAKAHREAPIPSLRDTLPKLPAKLDELVHGLLAKNPEWRYGSVQEVLAELLPLRADLQLQAAPVRREPAASPPRAVAVDQRIATAKGHRQLSGLINATVWLLILGSAAAVIWRLPGWRTPIEVEPAPTVTPVAVTRTVTRPVTPPVARVEIAANTEAWRIVQAEIERDASRGDWGAAERALTRFASTPALPPSITEAMQLAQSRLQVEGEAWYQAKIAALPSDPTLALAQLAHLRDVAITSERGDAEARYQEVQARLVQRLNVAKRAARQAVENGELAKLASLGGELETAFRGTPIAGVQRQFATACAEAVPAARFWRGTWSATKVALAKAAGAEALPAAAALLLAGEVNDAKRLLLGDPALQGGELLRRREALLGREAAVLAFNDPGDLQFIESSLGELRFADGGLSGPAGETVAFLCSVPIGGADWEAALVLQLTDAPGAQAQATIAAVAGEVQEASVAISSEGLQTKVHAADGWQQQESERPMSTPLNLRLVCRSGVMQIIANGVSLLEVKDARVPTGAQLTVAIAGAIWSLDELQVVGGG